MLLLVGLGNPGSNYTNTRHNIGFKIIDAINAHFKLSKQKPKFKGLLTTGNITEKKIYAIKPLTFMNNSGTAIKELIDYFKIDAKDVFVFHDDMDIDFGKIKAKFGGSSAGHNGIESIDKFIGKDYSRVRIGIGHPKQKKKVNNHVLEDFKEDEEEKINEITENIVKQLPTLIEKKIYAIKPLTFMNNSGTAIKELIDYFKIDAKDVIVFHDDMDIDFGKIKAKFGGSSAGHNGIESIDKFIGKDYSRVRIGIGHPKQKKKVNNHVLEDFKEDEEERIKEITENIEKQIPTLIDKKMDLFSSKVNQNLNGI